MSNNCDNGRILPEGWHLFRLRDICEKKIETRNPSLNPDESFYYVDISSVDNNLKQIISPKKILGRDAPSRARQVIKTGDVLVSTTRPNLNAVAMVPSQLDNQICSTGFCVLRPAKSIHSQYLFSFVQNREFVQALTEIVKGALYPAVTDGQVLSQLIPVPDILEQERIAGRLKSYLLSISRARAAAESQLAAAMALPAAYLREVFESLEARKWPRKSLGELCQLLPSKSISTIGDAHVQAITTACLSELGFLPSGVKPAKMRTDDAIESKVSPGEILVARSNTPELVGRVSIYRGIPEDIVASDLTIRIKSGPKVCSNFLNCYLSYLYVIGHWKERAGGASGSMKKITRSMILCQDVPLPPLEKQNRISKDLNETFASLFKLRQSIEEQNKMIQKFPMSMLRQAFKGEL